MFNFMTKRLVKSYNNGYVDGYAKGYLKAQSERWAIDSETGEEVLIQDGRMVARRERAKHLSWAKYYH